MRARATLAWLSIGKGLLSDAQWESLQKLDVQSHEDALQALIVYGFENRRLKRLRLRGRGRDRVWAEAEQQERMAVLLRRRKPS